MKPDTRSGQRGSDRLRTPNREEVDSGSPRNLGSPFASYSAAIHHPLSTIHFIPPCSRIFSQPTICTVIFRIPLPDIVLKSKAAASVWISVQSLQRRHGSQDRSAVCRYPRSPPARCIVMRCPARMHHARRAFPTPLIFFSRKVADKSEKNPASLRPQNIQPRVRQVTFLHGDRIKGIFAIADTISGERPRQSITVKSSIPSSVTSCNSW